MKIITRDFGEVEIDEKTIITFPEGIIGFEQTKRYALLSPLGDGKFPMWLQSVENAEPCFVVYDPALVCPNYRFEISDEEQGLLNRDGGDSSRRLQKNDDQPQMPDRAEYKGQYRRADNFDGTL